ncbi:sugar phosphate isomerase/epimerase family protein [Alicyclobacillus dauci]|uniref:Sugar phosphate isomerase/epimerase n=1 Tax=Alicyclobacillus dauci TaxID=1475485 RepID=A0ABY6Z6E9_9BACL|nr:sugar phosphate isomerase/epimerase family protein [Alicyclobacillus dauci]WAH38349.1 sugar phosphate isomerase/epimerase [Alicyclobacillus dauci]
MKPCLHPSIVEGVCDLDSYLDVAKVAGFEFVEVDWTWLDTAADKYGESYLCRAFSRRSLTLASFGLPVDLYCDEALFQSQLQELPTAAERAVRLGATRSCTWLWPAIDEVPVPYASRLARRIRECAGALIPYGIRLGLEFVGPHHLRDKRFPFVQNLQDLIVYLEAINMPNVGILLDSYHWYTAEVPIEEILSLKAHQIVHVHINDTDALPSQARDFERLLPGDGRIELGTFLLGLKTVGYTGPVSLEVLHTSPLAERPEDIPARAHTKLSEMLDSI